MIRRDYLIIGAGAGGASVCEGIREFDRKGSVMMVGAESLLPYRRQDLLENCLQHNVEPEEDAGDLVLASAAHFENEKIDLRLDTMVTQINLERRIAVLSTGQAVEFRKACLAMGSHARRPAVAGAGLGNIFYLRTLRDGIALREVLKTETQVVIVGGGCVAAQVAGLLSKWPRLAVTLVHRGKALWGRWLDESTATWLTAYLAAHGVTMKLSEPLNGFEGRTVLKNVQSKSGQRFPATVAVVAIGTDPNLSLVANTPLSYPQGTPVDDFLETDEKGIYAVGDLAAYPDRIFGGQRRLDQLECTLAQGRLVGANMTGKKRQRFEWIPHRTVKILDLKLDMVGDFSRPHPQMELEGDRAKKSFVMRYYQPGFLTAALLCNQPAGKVEALKAELRDRSRELKKKVA